MKSPEVTTQPDNSAAFECPFESEVVTAVVQSRWPDRVDAELRTHAASCAVCREVAVAAAALLEDAEASPAPSHLPAAGRVWWISQLRAKREAAETATRPITAAHLVAIGCAGGFGGILFGATFHSWTESLEHGFASFLAGLNVPALIAGHTLAAVGVGAFLALIPTVLYLALRD